MARTYKIRKFNNGKNKKGEFFVNYSLTLPTPLAEKLEADFGEDLAFEIKLTKDGILYIPTQVEESVPDDLPFKAQKSKPAPKKAAAKPAANGKKAPAKKPSLLKKAPAAKKAARRRRLPLPRRLRRSPLPRPHRSAPPLRSVRPPPSPLARLAPRQPRSPRRRAASARLAPPRSTLHLRPRLFVGDEATRQPQEGHPLPRVALRLSVATNERIPSWPESHS
jgi:hypothetical protein